MSQPQQTIGDVIESRRRSRSKTPNMNLRVSSDREQNGSETSPGRVKVRKTPTVAAIEEEPPASGQKAAVSSQGRSTPVRKTRVVTSDYSSEEISPDRARQAAVAIAANAQLTKMAGQLTQSSVTTTTSTKTTTEQTTIVLGSGKEQASTMQITHTSSTSSSSGGGSAAVNEQKKATGGKETLSASSPKKEDATGSQKLTSTSTTTTRSSKTAGSTATATAAVIRTSTPKNAGQKMAAAKVILTPEELQQHAAYKEYLEAGEYWNKYPKTDYTYSELSPHRREVAPGLVAMPNMSRPSLNKHAERVQTMIQRNPEQEAFIRERYTSARSRLIRSNPYDSNDETDELLTRSSKQSNRTTQQRFVTGEQQQQSIVNRFFLSIVMYCFNVVDSVRNVFRRREEQHMYYTRIEDERGFFTRVYGFVSSLFINLFKRIYLMISSVLFLDAWLLQTSATNVEQQQVGQRKRRFLLFLLVLLPFLLIGGTLLYLDPSALDTLRASLPSGLPDLPELKLPNLPELKLPNLPELPEMPNVALPDVESVKQYVGERWTDLSDLSEFYLDQLKLASQNSVDAVRQLWEGTEEGVEETTGGA
uniref:Uncharacterized protein n=1 Tax=Anopheles dirus TaxID=7168 RepID=A0A9I3EI03_9DIPT